MVEAFDRVERGAVANVPHADRLVPAAAQQDAVDRREGDVPHSLSVPLERVHQRQLRQAPQFDGFVHRAARHQLVVRRHAHRIDALIVRLHGDLGAVQNAVGDALQIPQLQRFVLASTHPKRGNLAVLRAPAAA